MGKIVASFFISLDGVVESPDQWHFPYFNDEMGEAIGSGIATTDAFLMGRVLYEEWAGFWPGSTDDPFASFINNAPKYVVSHTLRAAEWDNTTIVGGDVAAGIRALKARTRGGIGMCGSATLARWLLDHCLLDELHLMVHPVVVGKGQRLFDDTAGHPLRLVSQQTFTTGVMNVRYAPADR